MQIFPLLSLGVYLANLVALSHGMVELQGYCRSGRTRGSFDKDNFDTIQKCRAWCDEQLFMCRAIEYNSKTGRCEIHYNDITHSASSGSDPVTCEVFCGPLGGGGCSDSSISKVGDGRCNVGTIKTVDASNPGDCLKKCNDYGTYGDCKGFEFRRYTKRCKLLNEEPYEDALREKPGYVCFATDCC